MARTASLPGMENPANEALSAAAVNYAELRDKRMALGKEEVDAKRALIELMKAHKLRIYFDDELSLTVTLTSKTDVKVKSGEDDEEEIE